MRKVVDDRVLVIDTFAVYMFFLKDTSIRFLYDLDDIRSREDIEKLREEVLGCLR